MGRGFQTSAPAGASREEKQRMTFGAVTATLMTGMVVTLKLFFLTLLIALPLGLVISMGSIDRKSVV